MSMYILLLTFLRFIIKYLTSFVLLKICQKKRSGFHEKKLGIKTNKLFPAATKEESLLKVKPLKQKNGAMFAI